MKTEKINQLIAHPEVLNSADLPALRQLVNDYPWCAAFQVLFTKAMKLEGDPAFQRQLKKTAIYSADRKVLYRLIMQPGLQASIAAFDENFNDESPEGKSIESTASIELKDTAQNDSQDVETLVEDSNTSEEQLLDAESLEREVLAQVAAQSYHLELESESTTSDTTQSETSEGKETKSESERPSTRAQSNTPLSFIDFITGGADHQSGGDLSEGNNEKEERLIDRFIQNEPKIERKSSDFFSPVNMGKMSLIENEEMVTETLAGIYARQGETEKARRAYQQLALKYPEKSSYFAALIKKLGSPKSKK